MLSHEAGNITGYGDNQLVGIRDECNEEHTHTRYWHYDGWDLLAQQFIESDDETLQKVRTDWAVSDPTALPLRFYNQTGQLTWQSPKRTLWGKAYLANDELGLNDFGLPVSNMMPKAGCSA